MAFRRCMKDFSLLKKAPLILDLGGLNRTLSG
jgi:hypothetical protein